MRRKPTSPGQLLLLGAIAPKQPLTWQTRVKISQANRKPANGRNAKGSNNFHSVGYAFVSPSGEIFQGVGIRAFAESVGLPEEGFRAVRDGRSISHHGWKALDSRDPKNRVSPSRIAEYAELYRSGLTCREIADRFGFSSANAIKALLKKSGFSEFRRPAPRRTDAREKFLRQCIRLYESGLNCDQIAAKIGHGRDKIYAAMKRSGYQFRTVEEARKLTLKERNDKICVAYKFGLSTQEVADRFGLASAGPVRRILKENGIQIRPRNKMNETKRRETADRYWKAYKAGSSLPEVAKRFGVSTSSVEQYLKKAGYSLRSASESQLVKNRKLESTAFIKDLFSPATSAVP